MCFSASASFAAAGVLTVVGLLTIPQVRKKEYVMVAAVPFLFAVQQTAEGIVWRTMKNPDYKNIYMVSVYIFLAFALSIWPLWLPVSLWLCEKSDRRKKILGLLSGMGAIIAFLYSLYFDKLSCSGECI